MTQQSSRRRDAPADGRKRPRVPPRWFITRAWAVHRNIHRITGGHLGLWRPGRDRWGTMRVTTTGRRTGLERSVILAYLEDEAGLVTLAMNGWGEGEPAWWRNLQARPDALVETRDGTRAVRARAASPAEAGRLWARWVEVEKDLDAYAALRTTPTTVVILTPRR